MANEKHLKILRKSVEAWNVWRAKEPDSTIDLSFADLHSALLGFADLRGVNLHSASLQGADLRGADLRAAVLCHYDTDRSGAHVHVSRDLMSHADLSGANLSEADLSGTDLSGTDLSGTDFSGARLGSTIVDSVDLRKVKDLESVQHQRPSFLGLDALQRSQGQLPAVFLKGFYRRE